MSDTKVYESEIPVMADRVSVGSGGREGAGGVFGFRRIQVGHPGASRSLHNRASPYATFALWANKCFSPNLLK